MLIVHERFAFGNNSTLAVKIIGGDHQCYALEDERRETKVRGETCIPEGRYEIKLRTEGGMNKDYLDNFPDLHEGMLWYQNVPGFTYVYDHIGNWEHQTAGCPLLGEIPVITPEGEFEVARSTPAYLAYYRKVLAALKAGERVFVLVREREAIA